jgi:glucosylceramidase
MLPVHALTVSSSDREPPSHIRIWVTAGDKHHSELKSIEWQTTPDAERDHVPAVAVDPQKKFQEILGFGGAFTDATCFTFNRMQSGEREKLLHNLFDPSELGLSFCRTCVGASDYSTKAYSFDDGTEDPELKRFSIAHDQKYILPVLRQARKANPDLFLFASPWSPPGWMKANGSMLGGSMRKHFLSSYANYFLKFLKAYEADGVTINAVTVQNEVDTDQDGNMPACLWPQEYEADFVANHLGPLLTRHGVATKIWIIDHNYNLWGRAVGELETPDVAKYTSGIAWHGYVGDPKWMGRVHEYFPELPMYWTEGGPDINDPNYATDWTKWSKTITDVLTNWCRSVTAWNLALDEQGNPNIGPFHCGGLVTVDSKDGHVTYSGQYWALSQYSRHIHPGARRIESSGEIANLSHFAAINADGKIVVVLTNTGPATNVSLRAGAHKITVPLEQDSVTTFECQ